MATQSKSKKLSTQKSSRITNYMEEVTDSVLGDILSKDKDGGLTSSALEDVKALALNRLWPMYITTASGKEFLKKIVIEDQVEKDVARELRAAMDIVKANPRR